MLYEVSYENNQYIFYNEALAVIVKCAKNKRKYAEKMKEAVTVWYAVNAENINSEVAEILFSKTENLPEEISSAEDLQDIINLTDIEIFSSKCVKIYYNAYDLFDGHSVVAEYSSNDRFSENYKIISVIV